MSEEENAEEAIEPIEVKAEEPQANPLFKTLFEIEEGEVDNSPEENVEEEKVIPMTLTEAVDTLDQPDDQEEEKPEEVETGTETGTEAETEIQAEAPGKSEPKQKKKLRKVVDPDIPEEMKPKLNFKEDEEVEVDEFASTLLPEEEEVYNLAKYASDNMGDKYKGYDNKFKDFFSKSKAFLDKRINDDPHYDPRDDDEYSTFIERNRPNFTPADAKSIERRMWIEDAKKEAREELAPETEKLRKKLEQAEKAPVAQQAKSAFRSMAQKVVIPEEYRETFETGGQEAISKFSKENPLEFDIMEKASSNLLTYGDALTDIFLQTTELNESNPVHKELIDWVNTEQDGFIKSGQTEQDGKMFMRRERYYNLPENNRSEYYTWSDDDLLKILALRTQEQVNAAIGKQREILKASGYTKEVAEQQVVQKVKQQEVTQKPPVVNATPRPGNNLNSNKPVRPNNAVMNVLGF